MICPLLVIFASLCIVALQFLTLAHASLRHNEVFVASLKADECDDESVPRASCEFVVGVELAFDPVGPDPVEVILDGLGVDQPPGMENHSRAQEFDRFFKENHGVMTAADLAAYRPEWQEPVHTTYRGYDVYTNPATSRGGIELREDLLREATGWLVFRMTWADLYVPYETAARLRSMLFQAA